MVMVVVVMVVMVVMLVVMVVMIRVLHHNTFKQRTVVSAPPFGKEGIGLAQTKKYAEQSVRYRIISKQKYC